MPLTQGQHLNNRYTILELLGQGGFGAVYKAWDNTLNVPCAVKESFLLSPEGQRQFLHEAQILAGLRHPNLPRVTDFFTLPEQGLYLVMDFVEGQDLEELRLQAGGRLPEVQALAWIAQVCDALSYLHRQRPPVIHRDIKPPNIRIAPPDEDYPHGRAMLVDFGIAKAFDPVIRTTMGARAVTPGFSPHEQYGQTAAITDPRTDLYALGATLYALLTGQVPPESVLRLLRDPLLPPRELNPAISAQTESLILQALQNDPELRFQSATRLRAAITDALSTSGSQPPVVSQPVSPYSLTRLAMHNQAEAAYPPTPPPVEMLTSQAARPSPWRRLGLGFALLVGLGLLALLASQALPAITGEPPTQTSQARASQEAGAALAETADTLVPSPLPSLTTSPPLASPSSTTLLPSLTASPLAVNLTNTPSGPFEYTVQEGDSLASIAEQFNTDLMTILALNPAIDAASPVVYIGQKILIPAPNTRLLTATPVLTTVPPGTIIAYTVLPGDTLEAIAVQFRSSVKLIMEENDLENVNDLFAGQLLQIPVNIASAVDGMVQVYIPGGTFQMGEDADRSLAECQATYEPFGDSTCSRDWFTDEEPVHTVTLDAFWMDQTEVTNGMYAQCVAAGACSPPNETGSYTRDSYYGEAAYADYPVIYVDWNQADAYCTWAGRELPSEAQWEYAARGGLAGKLYPWGDTFDGSLANFCDANCPFDHSNPNFNDGYADTAPVGSYPVNGYGLYDMAGNVWEWVADWYGSYSSAAVENPSGPSSGDYRALRGGSWYNTGGFLRVSWRLWNPQDYTPIYIGFRCSRSP